MSSFPSQVFFILLNIFKEIKVSKAHPKIMFFVYLFISISLTFFTLSVFGLYQFPDVYTRLHSSGLSTTFGFLFFTLASTVYLVTADNISYSLPTHIVLAAIILLVIEPCIAHTISRTAHRNGIKPKRAIVDKLDY